MRYVIPTLLIIVCTAILSFTGYLFYFADCAMVKTYWFVVQTPARCL